VPRKSDWLTLGSRLKTLHVRQPPIFMMIPSATQDSGSGRIVGQSETIHTVATNFVFAASCCRAGQVSFVRRHAGIGVYY
jgi:hypothetical protein